MGGLAFIVPRELRKCITQVNCKSWRLQALQIELGNEMYFVINSYLPTDQRTRESNQEIEAVLAEACHIISSIKFDALYVLGDVNCDFVRTLVMLIMLEILFTSTVFFHIMEQV